MKSEINLCKFYMREADFYEEPKALEYRFHLEPGIGSFLGIDHGKEKSKHDQFLVSMSSQIAAFRYTNRLI